MERRIQRGFRFRGLSVRSEAIKAIVSVLNQEERKDEALNLILDEIKSRVTTAKSIVDRDLVAEVVAELTKNEHDLAQESIQVIDSFRMPRLRYNGTRKNFYILPDPKSRLDGETDAKINVFRDRFTLLHQRLMRDQHFAPSLLGTNNPASTIRLGKNRTQANIPIERIKLTQLESLIGSTGHKCLFGRLSRLEDDDLYLEDLNGKIRLDISRAECAAGIITEGSVVLVEGELEDDIFRVDTIGFPPPETREESLSASGGQDFVLKETRSQQVLRDYQKMEEASSDTMFVILSEVHLDKVQVRDKLATLFQGYAMLDPPPSLFVLMGNFCSKKFGYGNGQCTRSEYNEYLGELGDIIGAHENLLRHSHFVFIPGPNDPGGAGILPRPPIPSCFCQHLSDKVLAINPDARITFTTNPTRIMFYSQTLVFFREDLMGKMLQHIVISPDHDSKTDLSEQLVRTVIEQSHLCPYPTKYLFSTYDSALRLYPLPHKVVIADKGREFLHDYAGCGVVNPGFFEEDFGFIVYRPATQEMEFSKVYDE